MAPPLQDSTWNKPSGNSWKPTDNSWDKSSPRSSQTTDIWLMILSIIAALQLLLHVLTVIQNHCLQGQIGEARSLLQLVGRVTNQARQEATQHRRSIRVRDQEMRPMPVQTPRTPNFNFARNSHAGPSISSSSTLPPRIRPREPGPLETIGNLLVEAAGTSSRTLNQGYHGSRA
jgi:hypothetical protein